MVVIVRGADFLHCERLQVPGVWGARGFNSKCTRALTFENFWPYSSAPGVISGLRGDEGDVQAGGVYGGLSPRTRQACISPAPAFGRTGH
jgi:hypothetical protein